MIYIQSGKKYIIENVSELLVGIFEWKHVTFSFSLSFGLQSIKNTLCAPTTSKRQCRDCLYAYAWNNIVPIYI